ncbi:MAG: 23S rRNA methyltransferase, partial [Planctomycetaceae bacterium]|nr:23S rRNA methyltransferase [Planctomycetaceae bacterium]
TGLTLIDGQREIYRCLAAQKEIIEVFFDADSFSSLSDTEQTNLLSIVTQASAQGAAVTPLSSRPFSKIAFGNRNEGIVAVARFRAETLADFKPRPNSPIFLLEGIEKPGNLGAIFRTADAAGFGGVIICGKGTDASNPAVIRASLGTVFHVPVACDTSVAAIQWCEHHQQNIVAATPVGTTDWHTAEMAKQPAILLGSEAHGISSLWFDAAKNKKLALQTVALPMLGLADSLNVSATAAVLAYESVRQRNA